MRLCKTAGSLTVFIAKMAFLFQKWYLHFIVVNVQLYLVGTYTVRTNTVEMYNNYEMQQSNSHKKKSVILGEINVK